MSKPTTDNVLYYGDNLDVLRRYVPDESVDLVYLDPPFKSDQDYNVLFAEKDGSRAHAQIKAFDDTWCWDEAAARQFEEVVEAGGRVSLVMQAFRAFLGESDMLAYLAMMAPRLVDLCRAMKSTGSLYLHCDPTASHYLKLLLDAVFGPQNFVNEIVWKRSSAHNDAKQGARHYGRVSDSLLFYSKGDVRTFNVEYAPYDPEYIARDYRRVDADGRRYRIGDLSGPGGAAKGNPYYEVMGVSRYWRYSKEKMDELIRQGRVVQTRPGAVPQYKRYLDEMPGVPIQNIWTDIPVLNNRSREKLGYPTQKPEALLERIIRASSNEGDVVLDPFCGCGTSIVAAQKLERRWIGIDITHLAVNLIRHRLLDAFGSAANFDVVGEPVSVTDAESLARSDPYQFQWWALGLVGARPVEEKKGADKGIDGRIYFHDDVKGAKTKQIVLSVKAGNVTVSQLRDLRGVLDREGAEIGVLVALNPPTAPMRTEAASAGFYDSPGWRRKYPRLQVLTVAELLDGRGIDYPRGVNLTYKQAERADPIAAEHPSLFGTSASEAAVPAPPRRRERKR
ncbi:MAG: site-specific DNA-methyltransferase [Candidatus Binatia bacterium]